MPPDSGRSGEPSRSATPKETLALFAKYPPKKPCVPCLLLVEIPSFPFAAAALAAARKVCTTDIAAGRSSDRGFTMAEITSQIGIEKPNPRTAMKPTLFELCICADVGELLHEFFTTRRRQRARAATARGRSLEAMAAEMICEMHSDRMQCIFAGADDRDIVKQVRLALAAYAARGESPLTTTKRAIPAAGEFQWSSAECPRVTMLNGSGSPDAGQDRPAKPIGRAVSPSQQAALNDIEYILHEMYASEPQYYRWAARECGKSLEKTVAESICALLVDSKQVIFLNDTEGAPVDKSRTAPAPKAQNNGHGPSPAKSRAKRRPKTLTGKAR